MSLTSDLTIQQLNEQIAFILNKSIYFYQHSQSVQLISIANIEEYYDSQDWQTSRSMSEVFQKKTIQLFHYLLKELEYVTDSSLLPVAENGESSGLLKEGKLGNVVLKVYEILRDNGFDAVKFFHHQEVDIEYKLLQFLLTEIQFNVMINHSQRKVKSEKKESLTSDTAAPNDEVKMEVEETVQVDSERSELSQLLFQYDKICRLLNLHLDESANAVSSTSLEDVIDSVQQHFQTWKQTNPSEFESFLNLAKVFQQPPALTSQQQQVLQSIQDVTFQDFQFRRQMLLKRFQVTIQTFLDKAAPSSTNGEEAEKSASSDQLQIRHAIESQQRYLHNKPLFYEIEDALNAPFALLIEHSQKITNQSHLVTQKNRSIVKKVIIGKVPDRGGRVNELRPKRLDDFRSGGGGGGHKFHGKRNASTDAGSTGSHQSTNTSDSNKQQQQQSNKKNNKNNNHQGKGGGHESNRTPDRVVEIVNEDNGGNNNSSNNNNQGNKPNFHQRKRGKKDHH